MVTNGHSRRLEAISRKLTPDPKQPISLKMTLQAIAELEANPARTHILGLPRDRLMSRVEIEIQRLQAELGEQ